MRRRGNVHGLVRMVWVAVGVVAWLAVVPRSALALEGVCARVQMEVRQELTLERQAFDAHMRITNGLSQQGIENVAVEVTIADEHGVSVPWTSDSAASGTAFFLRVDTMEGISDVAGAGEVLPNSVADIHWLIIPAPGASNGAPQGTYYAIGATLSYMIGGVSYSTVAAPDAIVVKPLPQLTLDFFQPTDVYADDPFTPEIEPAVPFGFGVRVKNNGPGDARSVKIDSAQPKIVDSPQGLLVAFVIEGTEVNGELAPNTLLADFGDIAANQAGVARWQMTTTLSGRFTSVEATFSHADTLGGQVTSLLDATNTHTLVHDVRVDVPGRDGVADFLANDGGVLQVYESDNRETVVADVSASASLEAIDVSGTVASYSLTIPAAMGLAYARVPDPLDGTEVLTAVVRSDGKLLPSENAWLSKTRDPTTKEWQYFFHLFDSDSTGTYTLTFESPSIQNQPPVLQFIAGHTVVEGQLISFVVEASDPNGTVPTLSASPLPAGATFTDGGDGTAVFAWTPQEGQWGEYPVTFRASDGTLEATRKAGVVVYPIWDVDGDGMADDWEREHFGDLSRDGTGDFDGDGVADLAEFLDHTDPASGFAPSLPVVAAPMEGSEVAEAKPTLVVVNSTDPDSSAVTYEFEVFTDGALDTLAATSGSVSEGAGGTTSWTIPFPLLENHGYVWRVRATDGRHPSLWAYGRFAVNTANEPPASAAPQAPADGGAVDGLAPVLVATRAIDPDGDPVSYGFDVYADAARTVPLAAVAGLPPGSGGTASWVVDPPLADGATYYWTTSATDEHGAEVVSTVRSFTVNTSNGAPSTPTAVAPTRGEEVPGPSVELAVENALDPDGDTVVYAFELDAVDTFDSIELQAVVGVPEGGGTTTWAVPGAFQENTRYFWRVRAEDPSGAGSWSVQAVFFVNGVGEPPPTPVVENPSERAEVATLSPTLFVAPVSDPDGDRVTYDFEVYADAASKQPVASASRQGGSWVVPATLDDGHIYRWRARAVDEDGLASSWTASSRFLVQVAGYNVPPAIRVVSPDSTEPMTNAPTFPIAWEDFDPDSDGMVSLYYDDDDMGFDGTLIASGISEDDPGNVLFWDTAALTDGRYHVYAVVEDAAHEASAYAPGALVLDRTPPVTVVTPEEGVFAAPQTVRLSTEAGATIRYTTDGSVPDLDAPIYGAPIAVEATTVISFFAVDRTGNAETFQARTYVIDTQGPTGWVRIEEDAPLTATGDVVLTFSATDDHGGVPDLRLSHDGASWTPWEAYASSRVWTLSPGDGEKTVYVEFRDEVGNMSVPVSDAIVLDTTPPSVAIGSPVVGSTNDDTPTLGYTVSDGTVTVWVDDAGVPKVSGEDLDLLPEGDHTVRVEAVDGAGNVGVAETIFTVDTTAPAVAIASPAAEPTSDETPLLLYTVSDGVVTVRVDGVVVSTSSGGELAAVAVGDHTVRVEAVDDAGNVGFAEVTFAVEEAAQDLVVRVETSQGRSLAGVSVYAFTEAGSYTGTYATSDAAGEAVFDPAGFADGTYKFRIDYLGYPFWSDPIALPGTSSLTVTLAEEPTTILVSQAGAVAAGVRVYLFSASGAYLGQYATTDASGFVTFDLPVGRDYKVRADLMGSQYWSPVFAAVAGVPNTVQVDSGGGRLTATVDRGDGTPLAGVKVYLFSATGAYLSRNATTDAAGQVAFDVSGGDYKLRCDYLGYQFWSNPISVASDAGLTLSIPHRDVTVTVVGDDAGDVAPKEAVRVYLFTDSGAYQSWYEDTDAAGQASFRLPEKSYKVRADVLSFQYGSAPIVWEDPTITIPEGVAEVEVTRGGQPLEGVSVYVFNAAGGYLSLHTGTGADGKVAFRLPAEGYRFRADVDGSQFWSGDFALAPNQINPIPIYTGGGSFTLAVTDGAGNPIPGVASYLFDDAGAYLGENRTTDGAGEAGFDLSDGTYTFRTDHKGYSFWTDPVTVAAPDGPFKAIQIIDQQPVTATVQRDYGGALVPVENAPVYLFTEAGSYLGENQTTDASGHVGFDVPDRSYKVRADVLFSQYWSDPFTATDPTITIPEGQAEVSVTRAGTSLEGVQVYVFNGAGTYLQLNEITDGQGKAYFWLPEGTYRFRADAQGSQYFANATIAAHQVNLVDLSTGGGAFDLTVDDGAGAALAGAKVYVFTAAGSYIGLNGVADAQGRVAFTLSDGVYQFRIDHLGYSFWTPAATVPAQLSDVFSIAHHDVTVTVESLYPSPSPLGGVRVYLFTEMGAYQNQFADTDASGRVTFRLPDASYQVRADYLGSQFWSDSFVGTDAAVTIDHGVVFIHATDGGADAVGAKVYLFGETGAYLGAQETTDATGTAEFMVPAVVYTFRVDYGGSQAWSGAVGVLPGQMKNVEVDVTGAP